MASATGVLVADEDTRVREYLADLLGNNGYDPVTVASCTAAMAVLEARPVAVALVGAGLPDIPDDELLKHIRVRSPLTETIILTDPAALEFARGCAATGAFGYLTKPVEGADLLLHVRNAMGVHRARAELVRQNADRLLDPDPLIELDGSGAVIYLNHAAERLSPDLREAGIRHPLLAGVTESAGGGARAARGARGRGRRRNV
jgi:DNA-binding NtrC family response regulator